jgi:hypothetical protein
VKPNVTPKEKHGLRVFESMYILTMETEKNVTGHRDKCIMRRLINFILYQTLFSLLHWPYDPVWVLASSIGSGPGLSNAAPATYFPGALIYSAGFNVNQNFKKKIFLKNSMFHFFL